MRRKKDGRIDMITIAIHVHLAQKVNAELLRPKTVEGTSRPLKGVDNVKRSHCLALRMLSVSDRVTDNLSPIVSNEKSSEAAQRTFSRKILRTPRVSS